MLVIISFNLASKFAMLEIAPKVKEMDQKEEMDPHLIQKLFENGVI